jgi:endo-1,4-beta-D-glucanase Y
MTRSQPTPEWLDKTKPAVPLPTALLPYFVCAAPEEYWKAWRLDVAARNALEALRLAFAKRGLPATWVSLGTQEDRRHTAKPVNV